MAIDKVTGGKTSTTSTGAGEETAENSSPDTSATDGSTTVKVETSKTQTG